MSTISQELWVLMGLSFTIAVLHSLNPDHWLPFVMLGRSRNWALRRTLAIASVAGTAHVGTSIIIGFIGVGLGLALAESFATIFELITGSLLIIFGLGFAYLSWKRRGHVHGIPFLARRLGVDVQHAEGFTTLHGLENEHGHEHGHVHEQEPEHPDEKRHEHGHEHERKQSDTKATSTRAGYGLVAIIGLSPCAALLPVLFAAAPHGLPNVVTIVAVFFVATLGTVLLVTTLVLKGLQFVKLGFFEKHVEVITGLVIALMGTLIVGLGI